jgi:hypothetical protein
MGREREDITQRPSSPVSGGHNAIAGTSWAAKTMRHQAISVEQQVAMDGRLLAEIHL